MRRLVALTRVRISQKRASQRPRPVAVSARLAPSHASYRGPVLIWATGRLMSPDRGFGTSCLLHCGRLTVSANSDDSFSRTRLRRLVTRFLAPYINLLTYLRLVKRQDGIEGLSTVARISSLHLTRSDRSLWKSRVYGHG